MCLLLKTSDTEAGRQLLGPGGRGLVGSPEGLGQQQDSQCQRVNKKNSVKAVLLGRKTKRPPYKGLFICLLAVAVSFEYYSLYLRKGKQRKRR